jgi:hypothetical protein
VRSSASYDTINYNGMDSFAISLYWAESTDFSFVNYTLQWSSTSSNGPWTTLWVYTTKTDTSDWYTELLPGETSWWQIIDYDSQGYQASNQLQTTQPAAATLSYTMPTSTSVQFTWNNNAQYGGFLSFASYQLMESINGSAYSSVATITSESTMAYTINGLSSGAGYSFYVNTFDQVSIASYSYSSASNVVSLGTAYPLSASITAPYTTADAGQSLSFTCTAAGGVSPYSYAWTFGDGGTDVGQTVGHTYSPTGSMTVTCTVTDSTSATASGTTSVLIISDPAVTVSASHASADVGQSVIFTASASGGSGGYSYAWSGLPTGCSDSGAATLTCSPTSGESDVVTATIIDSNGYTATGSVPFTVYSWPMVVLTADRTSIDLGWFVNFFTLTSGGSGGDAFTYGGLPTGCSTSDSEILTCWPSRAGTSNVSVAVTDSNGASETGSLSFTVYSDPTVTLAASPSSLLLGQGLTLTATVQGGSGNPTYNWSGLPTGCTAGSSSPSVACVPTAAGSFEIKVNVTDGNRFYAASTTHVDVNPSFLGMAAVEGYALVGVIVAAVVIAGVIVYVRTRRRKKSPPDVPTSRPPPPPPPEL